MPKGVRGWTIEQRLMDKIKIDTDTQCWEWQASKNNIGYGMFRQSAAHGMVTAHRIMYETHNNTIVPKDKVVMHSCSNYSCVNPEHLSMATRKDVSNLMKQNGKHQNCGTRKQIYRACKHCGLFTSLAMLARWHDDKCKNKPNA